jgi:transcriptional regulator with XRE-family HTH domain
MAGPPAQPPERGVDLEPLGVVLGRLRRLKGLSGHDLGQASDMSQSKVSRIERGLTLPTPAEVDRLLTALEVPASLAVELHKQAQRLRMEMIDARAGRKRILHFGVQQDIADLEKAATTIRIFQTGVLPGLLQTDEYARAVLSAFVLPLPAESPETGRLDVLRAVDQRMERQQVLNSTDKKVLLIFTEAVLSYRLCPPDVMLVQLRKIMDRAQLPNVTIAILEQDTQLRYPPVLGFEILDDKTVLIDAPTTGVYAHSDEDVRVFQTIFDWYLEQATTEIDEILNRYFQRYARIVGDSAE